MKNLEKNDKFKIIGQPEFWEVIEAGSMGCLCEDQEINGNDVKIFKHSDLEQVAKTGLLDVIRVKEVQDRQKNVFKDIREEVKSYSVQDVAPKWKLKPTSALETQVGGAHYPKGSIQPIEYIHANDLDFIQGCVVKYITRFREKNGLEDLKKIKHYIDLLIELEYNKKKPAQPTSALETQVGGAHYPKGSIQPIEYIHANNLDFIQGCVVKYITRFREKNGLEDLKKIKHYIDLLIELEYNKKK